jgi:hypothetical protein
LPEARLRQESGTLHEACANDSSAVFKQVKLQRLALLAARSRYFAIQLGLIVVSTVAIKWLL